MMGSKGHAGAMDYLEAKLKDLGLETQRQPFRFPGWIRGESELRMTTPHDRSLRAVALAYVGNHPPVEGDIAYVEARDIEKLDPEAIKDRVLLARQNVTFSHDDMLQLAEEHGVKGLLYTNRVNGGQVLGRTANRQGKETPFPVFSITQEEGLWMKRLLDDGVPVSVRMQTTSEPRMFEAVNLVATLPGETGERVVLGGHFDSWDLGQGAIDNGLGVAQIYEVARILSEGHPRNRHTIEFVWFDAEEFGLWGSHRYVEANELDSIRVMVNLDMVGRPIAINAMGFEDLVPELETYAEALGGWKFSKEVANVPWLGSDHHPFILKGIPAITFNAPIDHDSVRYYHDFADTMDKVDRRMLAESCAYIALLVHDLANSAAPKIPHLDDAATAGLFRDAGLYDRMHRAGRWPFGDLGLEEEAEASGQ
jgi:Iap family predicted aminopeptidase